jgi:hypothetical protein
MNVRGLELMTKKDLLTSLAELSSKQFVGDDSKIMSFDLKELKNLRKADLGEKFYQAVMGITGITIKDKFVPIQDNDLNGEVVEGYSNIAEARLSTETLNRFVILHSGEAEAPAETVPETPVQPEIDIVMPVLEATEESQQEVQEEVVTAELVEAKAETPIEQETQSVSQPAVEETPKKRGRKKAKTEPENPDQEAKKIEPAIVPHTAAQDMNRLSSVILAIGDLGAYSNFEEVAVLSDRIYLQAHPTRFSNLNEPRAISKNVTFILLATGFLKQEGGQYVVQGKLTDEILALRK